MLLGSMYSQAPTIRSGIQEGTGRESGLHDKGVTEKVMESETCEVLAFYYTALMSSLREV